MSLNLHETPVQHMPVGEEIESPPATESPRSLESPPAPPSEPPPVRARRRRGPWIALLVVAVVAAIVGAVVLIVLPAGSVDVAGTVTDARTGSALEDVTVSGGEEIVTTGGDGSFAVRAGDEAVLSFTAQGYQPSESAASETLMVRLEPVVLSGTVTSMMTDQGLSATVTREGTEVGSATRQGTLTAYGVIPGDRVVVTADGYEAAEVLVREGDLDVRLQPEFATSLAQIHEWVDAGRFGRAFGWVLREDLDVPLVRESTGQERIEEDIAAEPGIFAAGRSTMTLGGDDWVVVYSVKPGRAGDATYGWTQGDTETYRVEGQRVVAGTYWENGDWALTMWWMDPLLVIAVTDTAEEGEEVITAVMRGQGLRVQSFDHQDAQPARA